MKVEGKQILVILMLSFLAETAISGSSDCEVECCRGCEESFEGKISKKHLDYTQLRTRARKYYVSCGFWGWGSCTRYSRQYYIHKDYMTRYYKSVGMKCDPDCQCKERVSVAPPVLHSITSNATAFNVTTSNVTTSTLTTTDGN